MISSRGKHSIKRIWKKEQHSVASVRYPPIFYAETSALIRDDGNFKVWRV